MVVLAVPLAQMHADVLGVEIETFTGGAQGGALGAARLGALATGAKGGRRLQGPPTARIFAPDASKSALCAASAAL